MTTTTIETRACPDCGKSFTLSERESRHFLSLGLQLPVRCSGCRKARRLRRVEFRGRVAMLTGRFGFIETPDHRSYFFLPESTVGAYLRPGDAVGFLVDPEMPVKPGCRQAAVRVWLRAAGVQEPAQDAREE